MARKIVLALGVLVFVIGGALWWRATHPPLTDEEQIAANLEDIRTALENNKFERALGYIDEDAKFAGQSRSQLRSQLNLGFTLRRPDVRVTFSNTRTAVKGASATMQGHYFVTVSSGRSMGRSSLEHYDGEFSLTWEKRDGQWKITGGNASGAVPAL